MEHSAQQGRKPVARAKKGGVGIGKVVGILVIVAVIAVLYYAYVTYGSLPVAVLTAKQLNSSTLASIMLAKINSQPQVNVTYNGSIIVNNMDPNFYLLYAKDGSYRMIRLDVGRISGIGSDYAIVYMYNTTGPYSTCTSFYNAANSNSTSALNCTNTYYPYAALTKVADSVINVSTLSNVHTTSYGLSSYRGQPCYNINGTGTAEVNGTLFNDAGYLPSNLTFFACLSAQYNIPLTATATATLPNGDSVKLSIYQDTFSNSYIKNGTNVEGQIV